jgi:hypothetical protein
MADPTRSSGSSDWSTEEEFWRNNYRTRPYASEDRDFDYYRPGYEYGYESANRLGRRPWNEVEPDLRAGWDTHEKSGESTWDEIKHTVKDAWDRITGEDRPNRT